MADKSELDEQAICKAYKSGYSTSEVAKKFGIKEGRVDTILHRNQVQKRRSGAGFTPSKVL